MSRKIECPITKEDFQKKYESGKSPNELAKEFNVSRPTIHKWLKLFNIQKRDHAQSSKIVGQNQLGRKRKGYENIHLILENKDFLYYQRVVEEKSKLKIAKELGCSIEIINDYCLKHDILDFKLNESRGETRKYLDDKEYLLSLYNKNMTMEEIANKIGSSKATVSLYFKKHHITTKDSNEYDRKIVRTSKPQQEIIDFIKTFYDGEIKVNDRMTLGEGIELDIHIPEKNFAIEFNGLAFHHEEAKSKDKWTHYNKTTKCEMKNIKLFHIWSDVWDNKSDVVKSMIRNKMGMSENRIFARKTTIQEVPQYMRLEFFEQNHIQGKDNASIAYGLYDNNKLVACMSFAPARFTSHYNWELIRFANLKNTSVIGGFSKLLKQFRKSYPGSIVSYSDRSYSDGNVYKKNGFYLLEIGKPDYMYVDKSFTKRLSKRRFRKNLIQKQFGLDMSKMTESEAMKLLGFKRIWDCGKITWILQ